MKKTTLLFLLVSTLAIQAQNKLLSSVEEYYDGTTWQNSQGNNYEYDSSNNLISQTNLFWNSAINNWENQYQENYTYNTNNKISQNLYKQWNPSTSQYENVYRDLYTYTSGKITQTISQDWQGSQWVNSYKNNFSYTGNNFNTLLEYNWDGSQWAIIGRYTVTYNSNNKIAQIVDQEWNGSQWETYGRELFTYDVNNKMINSSYETWIGSNWVEDEKVDYIIDTNGNRLSETFWYNGMSNQKEEFVYDTANLMSNYAHPFADKTGVDYTYEDFPYTNKILSENRFNYNTTNSSFEINGRIIYNYINPITLSTEQLETTPTKLKIFPNPSNNFISISGLTESKNFEIYNVLGAQILKGVTSNSKKININNLTNGLYLLKLDNENVIRFIKN